MPPKIKITKKEIVDTALEIVRTGGAQALNARTIASLLHCSTQPIFSNFATMELLHREVIREATALSQEYAQREIACGDHPTYKATGMAYIRFAKEEPELFKLLYMCDRAGTPLPEGDKDTEDIESLVQRNTGLGQTDAKLFHLEMWAFVHGIATMFATGFLDLDWQLVSKMLTDAYLGLRKQYEKEG